MHVTLCPFQIKNLPSHDTLQKILQTAFKKILQNCPLQYPNIFNVKCYLVAGGPQCGGNAVPAQEQPGSHFQAHRQGQFR